MSEQKSAQSELIWANLLHLSFNMWEDWQAPGREWRGFHEALQFEEPLWRDILKRMQDVGMNMVVLDLGDGVQYQSHPEIVVDGAWSPQKLRDELARMRDMGIEPIPKLNFATTHDAWLGPYSRCVSTPAYYDVCKDLIAEAVELFDGPRFFHLGMDEETARHQRDYRYVVLRQHDLYWHDFHFLRHEVEHNGPRPWIWSDYIWNHRDEFLKEVPTSVLQSNWYYGTDFEDTDAERPAYVRAYRDLEEHGYEQVPTGSNHSKHENMRLTADYCREHVAPERLLGFMQTPWRPTIEEFRERHLQAVDAVAEAM